MIKLFSVVMLLLPPKFWVTEMQGDCITCVCFGDAGVTFEEKSFAFENFKFSAIEAGRQVLDVIGEVTLCS